MKELQKKEKIRLMSHGNIIFNLFLNKYYYILLYFWSKVESSYFSIYIYMYFNFYN